MLTFLRYFQLECMIGVFKIGELLQRWGLVGVLTADIRYLQIRYMRGQRNLQNTYSF